MKYIVALSIVLSFTLFYILYIFQDQSFFDRQFQQLGSYERQENVMQEAQLLMQYWGNTDVLIASDVYTHAEKEHLYDVKKLFHVLEYVFLLCLLMIVVGFRCIFTPGFSTLFRRTILGLLILFIILFGVGWFAWDWLFVHFHQLFFQGNWMFPENSFLIQSYPWEFFRNAMVAVLVRSGVSVLVILGGVYLLEKEAPKCNSIKVMS